jgi:hypothetical protein
MLAEIFILQLLSQLQTNSATERLPTSNARFVPVVLPRD